MPADALPEPRTAAGALEGSHCLRRTYRDALGRPMTGTVRITGKARTETTQAVVPAASVEVDLAGGVLQVSLLPGEYDLRADLSTADGTTIVDVATIQH